MKDSKKKIKVKGKVVDVMANTEFKVKVDLGGQEHLVRAHLSGKMRMNYIKLQLNDEVDVMISPADITRGIITYRH